MKMKIESSNQRKEVVAAISAGIIAFLSEEERAHEAAPIPRRATFIASRWSSFGREEIMRMRTLWQRRMS